MSVQDLIAYFLKDFIYLFLERGREGKREGEKHQCVVASLAPPTGNLARNPGMCPEWELSRPPFGVQAGTQSNEPHQPGLIAYLLLVLNNIPVYGGTRLYPFTF